MISRVRLEEGNTEFWRRRFLGEGLNAVNGKTIDVKISEPTDERDDGNVEDVTKEVEDDDDDDDEEDEEEGEGEGDGDGEEVEVEEEVEQTESQVGDRVKDKEVEAANSLQMIGLQLLKDSDQITTTSKKSRRKVSRMSTQV